MNIVKKFLKQYKSGKLNLTSLSQFLDKQKPLYIDSKSKEYDSAFSSNQKHNKAMQSWRAKVGYVLEQIILEVIKYELRDLPLKVIQDKNLTGNSNKELDMVYRMLQIPYGKYSFLPDADIIIYDYDENANNATIYSVISIKNSFRERGFETTYWAVKMKENANMKHIKYYLSTPDRDDEISQIESMRGPKKMRVILEYELDGIYMLKGNFDRTIKVKDFGQLVQDIKGLLKN